MPRTYKRSPGTRRYADYTEDTLRQALQSIRNGMHIRTASHTYGISERTLFYKMKSLHVLKPGGQTVFSEPEETRFKNNLMAMADFGLPIDRDCLRIIVRDYLKRIGRNVAKFQDGIVPGIEWCYGFEKRHPDLAFRDVGNTKPDRAKVEEDDLRKYIAELEKTLDGVEPDAIYNFDETNLADDPGKKRIYFRRTRRYPELIRNHSKACISLMLCGNAAGDILPPYIVYKSKHLWDSWKVGGPKGTMYDNAPSGWFDSHTFNRWFKNMFLRRVLRLHPGKKVVLIGDNLSSHFDNEIIELCEQHNISFVCLPANSTHYAQPLDVTYFRPFKIRWRAILGKWRFTAEGRKAKVLPKNKFPALLKQLIEALEANDQQNLKSGFEACGIFPISYERLAKRALQRKKADELEIDEAFKAYLAEQRAAILDAGPSIKRKRRKVVPGRAVTREDLDSDNEVHDPPPEKPKQKPKRKKTVRKKTASDTGDEVQLTYDSDDLLFLDKLPPQSRKQKKVMCKKTVTTTDNEVKLTDDADHLPQGQNQTVAAAQSIASCSNAFDLSNSTQTNFAVHNIKEGDFVIVKYEYKAGKKTLSRLYVGQVENQFANQVEILFLRSYKGSMQNFVFPLIKDLARVQESQIVALLPKPVEKRGVFHFPKNCY